MAILEIIWRRRVPLEFCAVKEFNLMDIEGLLNSF